MGETWANFHLFGNTPVWSDKLKIKHRGFARPIEHFLSIALLILSGPVALVVSKFSSSSYISNSSIVRVGILIGIICWSRKISLRNQKDSHHPRPFFMHLKSPERFLKLSRKIYQKDIENLLSGIHLWDDIKSCEKISILNSFNIALPPPSPQLS